MSAQDSLVFRFCKGMYPTDRLVWSPGPLHPSPTKRGLTYVSLSYGRTMTVSSYNGAASSHKHESLRSGVMHAYSIFPTGFISRINNLGCLKEAYSYNSEGTFRLHNGCGGWAAIMTS